MSKNQSTVVSLAKPEETPPPVRTMEEIQTQYAAICQKAGQAWYHSKCLEGDLELFNRQMRELNQEAAILKQKQDAEATEKKAE